MQGSFMSTRSFFMSAVHFVDSSCHDVILFYAGKSSLGWHAWKQFQRMKGLVFVPDQHILEAFCNREAWGFACVHLVTYYITSKL